jgi:hypothetical protein
MPPEICTDQDFILLQMTSTSGFLEKYTVELVFMTLLLVLLQSHLVVVFLLERALISWSSAINERSEYQDLRGSDRRSVIPYINRRIELYYSRLTLLV